MGSKPIINFQNSVTPVQRGTGGLNNSRNMSLGFTGGANESGLISPGYQSILQSARREAASGMNFQIGLNQSGNLSKTSIMSPERKKNNSTLLFGKQSNSNVRLQLQ